MFRKNFFLLVLHGFLALLIAGCAGTVIKMPKPMPDIVSSYKSVIVYADRAGMQNSGLKVNAGDYVTLMAKGEVDLWPTRAGHVYGPSQLLYRTGKKFYARSYYYSTPGFTVGEGGNIYLGIADGPMDSSGEPKSPDYYRDNKGHFVVDIIVWQKEDPIRISDFLEEISRKDPQNKDIRTFVEQFNNLKKNLLAVKKAKEVEETKKETVVLKEKEIQKEKEPQKEKPVQEMSEKRLQEVKDGEKPAIVYEDSKAKVSIITKPITKSKDKDTSPPRITIISPQVREGMRVASKTSRITLVGKATDESGVAEVMVNGEVVELDEKGNFSADVLLKIGENEINIAAIDIHKNQATQSFKIVREGLKAAIPQVAPVLGSKGKYYALIVGNNDYTYIPKLEIAKKDAVEVEKLLRENYGFETRLLVDATRIAILNAINDLRKKVREDDSLLIYYAGHGDYDKVADKAYWLPVDAERDNPTNWIMSDDITTNIKRMASKHVLIVSDSCYSGTFVRSVVTDLSAKMDREGFIKRMLEKASRTLMSSGGNEPVLDSGASGHSVFAESFLRGLREMEERVFTADELFYGVIRERVIGKAEQTPQYNNIRNSGHEGGDFVFMKK
jgi:septum formation inhibitor MinC